MVIITPRLVKPVQSADALALPTDNFRPTNDVDQYLMGRLQGPSDKNPEGQQGGSPEPSTKGVDGDYGHQL